MNYWLLVTHPANFEVMKAKNMAAMKTIKCLSSIVYC